MGSAGDFVRSTVSDALLPFARQLLDDVVMEVINDRQIPSRSDFKELRDLVNQMRGQVSTAATANKAMRDRVEQLEAELAGLKADMAAMRVASVAKPKGARRAITEG